MKYLPNPDILLFDRSIRALLVGLFSNERLANDMSAVTLVMIILGNKTKNSNIKNKVSHDIIQY